MELCKIGQVCEINPRTIIAPNRQISFVPMTAVSVDGKIDTSKTISPNAIKNYTVFQDGDILFAKITPCMENGKGAIAEKLKNGYGAGSTEFIVLRPNQERVRPKWLQLFLSQKTFRLYCQQHMTGSAGQKRVPSKFLANCEIPIPSLLEQEHIVARIEELFSQLDASVNELKTAKERLKVYRQAVVTAAYPALTKANTVRLSDIAEITGGITKGRKLENSETVFLPYLRVANVQNGFLDLSEVKQIELKKVEVEQYLLKFGDVLYTEGGDRDKLGRGTIWRNEIENCVHQNHVFKARIEANKALSLYVAYWSMGTPARNYFYAKGKQSVNLASINKTVLSMLPIPLIPIAQQEKVIAEIETKFSVCDSIEKTVDAALQQAEALRQSILKKAFEEVL